MKVVRCLVCDNGLRWRHRVRHQARLKPVECGKCHTRYAWHTLHEKDQVLWDKMRDDKAFKFGERDSNYKGYIVRQERGFGLATKFEKRKNASSS